MTVFRLTPDGFQGGPRSKGSLLRAPRVLVLLTAVLSALALLAPAQALRGSADAVEPPHATRTTTSGYDVRVGSFNIKNVLFARRPMADWKVRREVIIRQVLGEEIGLLGIQEAHQGRSLGLDYPDGENQYTDLKRGLNKAGGSYRLTTTASYNCQDPDTFHHCRYQDRGASRSTRILYDHELFELVRDGSVKYRRQIREDRYLVWAVFRVRETGQKLLFTTTHLTSRSERVRLAQWRQSIRIINDLKGRKPVIATGDYNVNKYHPIAARMLPAMREAGYGDVLNQEYRTNPVDDPRAESTENGWINSYNYGRRDVEDFSFEDQRNLTGMNIDWVFASNDLPVKKWKVVVDYDPDTLRVEGALPSDHNLVRARIRLT